MFSNLKEAEKAESKLAVIACFDDPFLLEARRTISIPTIGIGWAAFTMCSLYSDKFGVITTVSEAVPVIEDNLKNYGLLDKCSFVTLVISLFWILKTNQKKQSSDERNYP